MPDLQVFWKGKIPLDDVIWNFAPEREVFLSNDLEKQRENIWNEEVSTYPETYDGDILVLEDYNLIDGQMIFDLGFIKFSRVLTLAKVKQRPPGYGTLGMQAIIFSSCSTHVLAGKRTENTSYCPLFHTVPGGILEVSDTKRDFESACMRELHEEVDINLKPEKYLTGIIQEYHGSVGVAAIISTSASDNPKMNEKINGNEEWKGRELSWYPVDHLDDVTLENSLEGLLFLKKEREIFTQTGSSVFW